MKRLLELVRRSYRLAVFAVVGAGCTATQPTITSLGPQGTLAGSPGFTLTIHGTEFSNETTVLFGDALKNVRFVDGQTIEIDVEASEIATPGDIIVTVTNGAAGPTTDQPSTFETFHVVPVEEVKVAVTPGTPTAPDGKPIFATTDLATLTAEAVGSLPGGPTFARDVTTEADWSSSDDAVATVTDGLLGPQAEGSFTVEATLDGITGSVDALVIDPAKASVEPASLNLSVGTTDQLNIVTSSGVGVNAVATWTSGTPVIATVDDGGSSPGRVVGVAEGSATVTATLFGENLTSQITVTTGGGGGGTSSDQRIVVIALDLAQEAIVVPVDETTGTLQSPQPPLALSGSPNSLAFDPASDLLLIHNSSGFDVFANGPGGVSHRSTTAQTESFRWGDYRHSDAVGGFTAPDALSGGRIERILLDVNGKLSEEDLLTGLPNQSISDHIFLDAPTAGEVNFISLSPPLQLVAGSADIDANGTLSDTFTYSLNTGLTNTVRLTALPDGQSAFAYGSAGIVRIAVDTNGDLVPQGAITPFAATPVAGFALDRTGACGFTWKLFDGEVETFKIDSNLSLTSTGVTTIPDRIFIDAIATSPVDDQLAMVGRDANDDGVVGLFDVDVDCSIWSKGEEIVTRNRGFLKITYVH